MLGTKKSNRFLITAIIICALLEVAMLTFFKRTFNPYLSSFIMLGGGLFTGITFLLLINGAPSIELPGKSTFSYKKSLFSAVFFIAAILLGVTYLKHEIAALPITDYYTTSTGSDIIPQIGILVDRYISGEFPYQLIHYQDWGFNHDLFPTYLPLTWMPFILAEVVGLDYRLFAFLILSVSLSIYAYKFYRPGKQLLSHVITMASALLFIWLCMQYDDEGMFRYSIETIIAGFYLLLSLSVLSDSNHFRVVAIVLCLLSRYALVLWLPLYFIIVLVKEKKKNTLIISLSVIGLVLVLYIIPFLLKDTTIFTQGYNYHSQAAIDSWKLMAWQAEGDLPHTLYKGMGFGWYFYENIEGSLPEKVDALRYFHFGISISSVLALLFVFFKMDKHLNYRLFLLGSLKIYLVIFYNFIQIPFSYLYLVPIIISIPIIGIALRLWHTQTGNTT